MSPARADGRPERTGMRRSPVSRPAVASDIDAPASETRRRPGWPRSTLAHREMPRQAHGTGARRSRGSRPSRARACGGGARRPVVHKRVLTCAKRREAPVVLLPGIPAVAEGNLGRRPAEAGRCVSPAPPHPTHCCVFPTKPFGTEQEAGQRPRRAEFASLAHSKLENVMAGLGPRFRVTRPKDRVRGRCALTVPSWLGDNLHRSHHTRSLRWVCGDQRGHLRAVQRTPRFGPRGICLRDRRVLASWIPRAAPRPHIGARPGHAAPPATAGHAVAVGR